MSSGAMTGDETSSGGGGSDTTRGHNGTSWIRWQKSTYAMQRKVYRTPPGRVVGGQLLQGIISRLHPPANTSMGTPWSLIWGLLAKMHYSGLPSGLNVTPRAQTHTHSLTRSLTHSGEKKPSHLPTTGFVCGHDCADRAISLGLRCMI